MGPLIQYAVDVRRYAHSFLSRNGVTVTDSDRFNGSCASYHSINLTAAGLIAVALAGCGGSSGIDTTAASPGGGGAAAAAPAAAAPISTAPVTESSLAATQFATLSPAITVGGVTSNWAIDN